jgi:hypothetical protein
VSVCSSGQDAHRQDARQRTRGPMERNAPMSTTLMSTTLMSTTVITKMLPGKNLEFRIFQLYVLDLMAEKFVDGCRAATLARCGSYEVRLVELFQDWQDDTAPFWIELFDHGSDTAIDSCGGYDLGETAAGAEALISQARLLHRDGRAPLRWPPELAI